VWDWGERRGVGCVGVDGRTAAAAGSAEMARVREPGGIPCSRCDTERRRAAGICPAVGV